MLRHKLSAGALRAAAHASSPAPSAVAVPGSSMRSPLRQQSREFGSSVRLNAARNWKAETVVALKAELKERGLSQTGNKSTLVDRLTSADTSATLPPVPQLRGAKSTPNIRHMSTTAKLLFPPKKATPSSQSSAAAEASTASPQVPTEAPKTPKTQSSAQASHASETVTSTGPEVSSMAVEGIVKPAPVTAEVASAAPGLPGSGSPKGSQAPQIPSAEDKIPEQAIPLTPDNFTASSAPSTVESIKETSSDLSAKVFTVASASTHHGGGPSHNIHEASDAHTMEEAAETAASEAKKATETVQDAVSDALNATTRAFSAMDLGSVTPEITLPKMSGGGKQYKSDSRPLDAEEKRGVWLLGGIVGLGLVFGGDGPNFFRGDKKRDGKKGHGGSASAASAGEGGNKVKGDAQWEKASAAGVVGHGARKD